jgi:phytoene desaturase
MPEQVDELFELYDKNPRDYFKYVQIEETCHYFFNDGTNFLFESNPEKRSSALIEKFGQSSGQAAIDYMVESEKTYNQVGTIFIDRPKYGIKNLFDRELIKRYPKLLSRKLLGSLNRWNERKLKQEHLVQIFNRYGTYNGSNPYQMSGLYSMIPHLELNLGTFFPEKGMRSIVDSLYDLAVEQGIEFRFDERQIHASPIKNGYAIETAAENFHTPLLVSAIDCVTFYKYILADTKEQAKYAKQEKSSSAVVFYWAVEKKFPALKLHNIFFGADYEAEFQQIFGTKDLPETPTVYVHISSVVNPQDAPENGQNWFVMINTPAGIVPDNLQRAKLRAYIDQELEKHLGEPVSPHVLHENVWDATAIEFDTGSHMGALYGAACNHKMAALQRHGNTSKKYKNLYFCGGTVHPGGGIPLVLKSAKIVSDLI